jgi:hypothetical protein
MGRSFFRHRLSVSAYYCPNWERPLWFVSDNGGRHAHECLDLNAAIWRFLFGLTIWRIGALSRLLRFIPDGPRGRGHTLRIGGG